MAPVTSETSCAALHMAVGKFNVGVIGYGLSAKIFHIPFINSAEDFHLYAIVQRNPIPDNDASKDFPDVKPYRSTEELVQDSNVHVVVVTTTPDSHAELVTLALRARKHVIVEKPFTPTSAEAQRLVDLAEEQDVLLTVYQNRRFDSDFLTLRKYIEEGRLGRVVEFETHFDRHRPDIPAISWKSVPRPGVSVVYDLGSHLLDQVIHLFGLPQRITGFVYSQREGDQNGMGDSCTILLHYSNGMFVTAKAGVISPETNQLRYWVRGTKGSFRKAHLDPQEDQLKQGMRPGEPGYAVEPSYRHGSLVFAGKSGKLGSQIVPTVAPATYTEFYRRFAQALKGDVSQLPVSPADAVALIRLIELAHQSSCEGRTIKV